MIVTLSFHALYHSYIIGLIDFFNYRILRSGILQSGPNQFEENQFAESSLKKNLQIGPPFPHKQDFTNWFYTNWLHIVPTVRGKPMSFYDRKDFLHCNQFCLSLNGRHFSNVHKSRDCTHSLYGFVQTAHRTDIFGF